MFGLILAAIVVLAFTSFEFKGQEFSEPVKAARIICQGLAILAIGAASSF